ncbi:MAG: hypothetical protein JSU87_15535 [Gemmatimonadota bacterium]|nr:MAG: hypothetical protein JSU87_15535 [Gemmatimonadota bacterium]
MSWLRLAGIAVFAALVLSACGGDDGNGTIIDPTNRTPTSVTGVAGNGQAGVVGQALAQALRVRVTDAQGRAVPNEPVSFVVTSGGGSVSAAVAGGLAADPPVVQTSLVVDVNTNSSGEAQATWTLGGSVGSQTATATVRSLTPAQFTATATAGAATQLSFATGPSDAVAGEPIAPAVQVEVRDAFGNLTNATVTIALGANPGGGTLSGTTSASTVEGVASFANLSIDMAAAGYTLVASTSGVGNVTSNLFGIAPAAPASLSLIGGNDQVQVIGFPLDDPFVVRVFDAYGNAVGGAPVAWEIAAGNGELILVSPATDDAGFSLATLVPGPVAEPVDVTASLPGLPPIVFSALGFAGILDPVPDEFSTPLSAGLVPPDIDALIAWREAEVLIVLMFFAQEVVPDDIGGPNTVIGLLEFDTDQDPATGVPTLTDFYRPPAPPGATGMGREFYVNMSAVATPTEYQVFQDGVGVTGTIMPIFDADLIEFQIPAALLGGDDLAVNMATIVGTIPEPTDIAPNDGNLSTSLPPAPVTAAQRSVMREVVKRGVILAETARLRATPSTPREIEKVKLPWERQ